MAGTPSSLPQVSGFRNLLSIGWKRHESLSGGEANGNAWYMVKFKISSLGGGVGRRKPLVFHDNTLKTRFASMFA